MPRPGVFRALCELWNRRQANDPEQVVRRQRHVTLRLRPAPPEEPRLVKSTHCLQPAELLFDQLSLSLADRVGLVARRSSVQAWYVSPASYSHMRSDVVVAAKTHEISRVISFVRAYGAWLEASLYELFEQLHCAFSLSPAVRLIEPEAHTKPVAILHDGISNVAELGRSPAALAIEPGLRIRHRSVRAIAALFAVKIHRRIARIVI